MLLSEKSPNTNNQVGSIFYIITKWMQTFKTKNYSLCSFFWYILQLCNFIFNAHYKWKTYRISKIKFPVFSLSYLRTCVLQVELTFISNAASQTNAINWEWMHKTVFPVFFIFFLNFLCFPYWEKFQVIFPVLWVPWIYEQHNILCHDRTLLVINSRKAKDLCCCFNPFKSLDTNSFISLTEVILCRFCKIM